MEVLLARYILLLLAALTLFCAPARAQTAQGRCASIRDGQAGAAPALQAFMADAQDALLWTCRYETAAGPQTRYELRGPRRKEGGVCAFDAIVVASPMGLARDLLADLPRTHTIYMRQTGAACPAQDDPAYTQTQTQFGVGYADQFLWAMRAWAKLRSDPQSALSGQGIDPGGAMRAMLARNRDRTLRVIAISVEAPSWRTVLNDPRVTLHIEAPEDPAPVAGVTYTVTIEPSLDGFDFIAAGAGR